MSGAGKKMHGSFDGSDGATDGISGGDSSTESSGSGAGSWRYFCSCSLILVSGARVSGAGKKVLGSFDGSDGAPDGAGNSGSGKMA